MTGFVTFIKDILMIKQEKGLVGLSGIKIQKKDNKKGIVKSVKKSDVRLSDLMRKKPSSKSQNFADLK